MTHEELIKKTHEELMRKFFIFGRSKSNIGIAIAEIIRSELISLEKIVICA